MALCTLIRRQRAARRLGMKQMTTSRRQFLATGTAGLAALALAPRVQAAEPLIAWQNWPDGLAKAAREHKGIGLLIYADWCPHCRELQPVLRDPATVHASQALVMIRQDADEPVPWLRERFGAYGTYVPRLFFLHPDGTLAVEIQSGNPRFPYFYQPQQGDALRAAMKQAAAFGHKH